MAKRGRPCGFDREQALRRALDVFWEAGYEGATMAALKEAMGGICAPSMYAAYGSKEALFRSAVELYLSQECQLSKGAFALPTARESIAALLESAAVSYTTEGKPRGCLVDLSTTNFSPANKGVEDYLRDHRRRAARLLRERYGYKGEIRAIGDVLRDQLFFMRRCGFDAYAIRADRSPEDALASLDDFSEVYQTSVEQPLPLFRRRG
ncbi:DUF934 domain-containing protein [Pseudomonas aeruginosa]|nr:DUF934 domain-containing protein [Pseudomonas aeruginosa]MBF3251080.1 DUF934 domain-containing protein [Pseudomonas aeruginosa]MBF3272789.1 DUF934 domain-containing protein [Pseudomonas aeruginosa]